MSARRRGTARTVSALEGLRVLDLGGTGAAIRAGALLADHGADVVAVRPFGLDPSFDRSKRTIQRTLSAAVLDDLASRAQVVLDGRPGADVPAWLARAAPGAVVCRLPAFPAGHPHADQAVPDAFVDASAGAYDPPLGRPVLHPMAVGATVAAAYAACAIAASTIGGLRPRWVEVPMFDAALHAQELRALLTLDAPRSWLPLQWASTPLIGTYRCADGRSIHLHAGLPHHLERFLAALRTVGCDRSAFGLGRALSPSTRTDPTQFRTVGEASTVRGLLTELFVGKPADAWERDLGGAGVCVVVCRTADEWRSHPQARGQWVELEGQWIPGVVPVLSATPGTVRPSREIAVEDVDWEQVSPAPRATHPPLAGLKVLDLAQIIAGPAAGRTLQWLGAEVVKIVNPRRESGFIPAFRSLYDGGKTQVRADWTTDEGRAALNRWLDWQPDVIVHNLTPTVADRVGIADAIARVPNVVEARVSAFGTSGPWGGRPGLEQSAQATTGVQVAYGGDKPDLVPIPATDLCTGLLTAFGAVCALVHRDRTGVGQRVEGTLTGTCAWLGTSLPEPFPVSLGRRTSVARGERNGPSLVAPRAGLRRLLDGRTRRVVRDVGEITVVLGPWKGAGLLNVSPESGDAPLVEMGRVRWVVRTAPWAVYLASTRS